MNHFLKNGGHFFYGSTNPEVAPEWINSTRAVLTHIGYPPNLWVYMAIGAMHSMGQLWWKSTHTIFLEGKALEQISSDEFRELIYF